MSSGSTADRRAGPAGRAGCAGPAGKGDRCQDVVPRSAASAASAAEDQFRWRGLHGPSGPGPGPPSTRASLARAAGPGVPSVAGPAVPSVVAIGPAVPSFVPIGPAVPSVVVIGLGNPILGDDGVGWRVVDALEARHGDAIDGVRMERAALGGLALMERLVGARRAILVDAMETGTAPAGTVTCLTLENVGCRPAGHLDSVHDMPLTAALAAGRALGADLPADVSVVAVEAHRVDTFSDDLSPAVAAAVPAAVAAVLRLLEA